MYDLLHAMEGSEEEEGLGAHICLIALIKVMCCLFLEPELEASAILGTVYMYCFAT